MPNQSPLLMSTQSPLQIRFEEMKAEALNKTKIKDLPQLLCDTCGLCTTFGWPETFEGSIFTLLDVCVCIHQK